MDSADLPETISLAPMTCSTLPSLPKRCSPSPYRLLLKVDCQVTTVSAGYSSVTTIVSGTSRPSFSENTPPDINAALGSGRSRAVIIQAIWCTMFSVTFPPENSQYNLQLINLNGSNSRSGRPFRKAFQLTFCAVQFEGTLRTH